MTDLQLTKTKMMEGVWEGVVTRSGDGAGPPQIAVFHQRDRVEGVELTHDPDQGHWRLSIPIPPVVVADGVHTLFIQDTAADEKIGHVTLVAGEALGDDIRAEMALLRAELDMLKRAFRRHCLESD
ncbi:MAG: hypothetical protein AAF744_03065 [Pseudomonadota bacterium]